MANVCLPKYKAEELKMKLQSGEISFKKLAEAPDSASRREMFSFLGDDFAKRVNADFESKLLLVEQEAAVVRMFDKLLSGKEPLARDTQSKLLRMKKEMTEAMEKRIKNGQEAMSEAEMAKVMNDMINRRLGMEITPEQGGALADQANAVNAAKQRLAAAEAKRNVPDYADERLELGVEMVLFRELVESIKLGESAELIWKLKNDKPEALRELLGGTKAATASLDASFIGIQGYKILTSHPSMALGNIKITLENVTSKPKPGGLFEKLGPERAGAAITKAMVWSRKNSLNGFDKKADLATGIAKEEAFPSSLPEKFFRKIKIKPAAEAYKMADEAFQSFALLSRAKMFDFLVEKSQEIMKKKGGEMTEAELRALGSIANNYSGRGSLGRGEAVGDWLNNTLFSPRFWVSNINYLTAHSFDPRVSKFMGSKASGVAHAEAATNLVKSIAVTAVVMEAFQLIGNEVEWDSRSTNFGKVNIGGQWVDLTGKLGSVAVLVSRLVSGEMITMSGKEFDLTSDKYGAMNRKDVLAAFVEGKTSPMLKAILDALEGENFDGEDVTLFNSLVGLVTPMAPKSAIEIWQNPKNADLLVLLLLISLNMVGFSVSTPK